MKSSFFLAIFCFISVISVAQSNKEDIAIIQGMFGKDKKALMTEYMTIPEDKKKAFWSLYDTYEDERKALGRDRIALIEAYANDYEKMDNTKAATLMNKKLTWVGNYTKMQKKYFDGFSKIIGATQASKFFQLEDYLENNIRLAIQESIPFIGELDKSKVKDATHQQ